MNIRKIIAPTMPEAVQKVKNELGENAVILHSKVIYDGGFLGMFRKRNFEVIAVLDDHPVQAGPRIPAKSNVGQDFNKMMEEKLGYPRNNENEAILEELVKLRAELTIQQHDGKWGHYPELVRTKLQNLQTAELDDVYIGNIADNLLEKWRNADMELNKVDIDEICKETIESNLSTFNFNGISHARKFINFVGPTGVGKTTTIAKLAAEAVLDQKKKVAFITTDTYRIAAIEQLKTYAELLHIPIEIVYEEKDFLNAVEKFVNCDYVFIDTAGRNYRDKKHIEDLKQLFGENHELTSYLVLSISMKEQDIYQIVDNFKGLNFQQFIFTKADETSSYGLMYNTIMKYKKGVAYITAGQDVPDDIVRATPEVIAKYLLRDELV